MLHRGYEIWISDSEGQRIPEYPMETEGTDEKTVACHIPSESGKVSGLLVTPYTTSVLNVWLIAGSTSCRPGGSGKRIGVRLTEDTCCPFQFSNLETTDDETALWTANPVALEELGTIQVRVVRIHAQQPTTAFKPTFLASIGAVYERSKKLGAQCVSLGGPVRTKKREKARATPLNPRGGPDAKFIFRYMPPALLQAQGIMPSSSPAPNRAGPVSGKGKSRAGSDQPQTSRILNSPRPSKLARMKADLDEASRMSVRILQDEVIELFDSDNEGVLNVSGHGISYGVPGLLLLSIPVQRKPAVRSRIKPEKVEYDPDDVIDLTLDG
ncbi:hypothetical protein C8Q77DRAFT_195635 [Trametes polyzona]|nr:hypothetical protein C8Q77DRAFT_195635 [Trametes polyzona]